MNWAMASVLITLLFALVFLFFGKTIIGMIPIVARFHRSRKFLLDEVKIGHKKIPQGQDLSAFCRRESSEVVTWGSNTIEKDRHQKMPTGTVVTILHYKESALNRTISELRTYSLIIIFFGFGGIVTHLKENKFEWTELAKWMETSPFQALDLLKIALVVFFFLRLLLEILSIRDLLKNDG